MVASAASSSTTRTKGLGRDDRPSGMGIFLSSGARGWCFRAADQSRGSVSAISLGNQSRQSVANWPHHGIGGFVALGARVDQRLALHGVIDGLGDVGGMVADSLKV